MGRKTVHTIGTFFGRLEVKEIIPALEAGKHVKLRCLCHYCDNEKIINGVNISKRNSCGCQQRTSTEWKHIGPKTMPWQLLPGESARRNLEYQYKRGAKRRQIDYHLTESEFTSLVTGTCFYCGDSLTNTFKGQGKTSGDFKYTGIDRVDSTKGYTPDNCVSCCWKCNSMKNSLTVNEFLEHIKKIFLNKSNGLLQSN